MIPTRDFKYGDDYESKKLTCSQTSRLYGQ